jgi:hypothetical protein
MGQRFVKRLWGSEAVCCLRGSGPLGLDLSKEEPGILASNAVLFCEMNAETGLPYAALPAPADKQSQVRSLYIYEQVGGGWHYVLEF